MGKILKRAKTKRKQPMKIILLSAALMLVALGNNAQTEKGRLTIEPRVGMTLSSFTGGGSGGATGKFGFTGCVDV